MLSVNELDDKGIKYDRNDPDRYDGFKEAISLSITFPNYLTFYRKRNNFGKRNWVILLLDKRLLWEKDCLYSDGNAASSQNSSYLRENRDLLLNNPRSFEDLFEYVKEYKQLMITRQTNLINKNITTNPQSEVLVFNGIEQKYIKEVHYSGFNIPPHIINNNPETIFVNNHHYFDPRDDYKYWRNNNGQ